MSTMSTSTIITGFLAFRHHSALIGNHMLDGYKPLKIALLWIPGIIGNGLDAVCKVMRIVIYIIVTLGMSLGVLFTWGSDSNLNTTTKRMWLLIADASVTLGIDILGLVVPYLAYKIDDYFVDNFTQKYFLINNPYHLPPLDTDCQDGYSNKFEEGVRTQDPNQPTDRDYSILGITKKTSLRDVKKAYKKLAIEFHPDKNKAPGAAEHFKEINTAYTCVFNYLNSR